MPADVVHLTVEEAVAALEAAAFTTDEPEPGFDPGGFEGPYRRIVHCFRGSLGADWDLAQAIALAERSDDRAWAPNLFGHELGILADGAAYWFQARRPE